MKSFKNHFSVIISLFVLLCSFESIYMISKIIKSYESNLNDDYSIVVVAKDKLNKEEMLKKFSAIKSIEDLDSSKLIDRVEKSNTVQDITFLKKAMPNFYTIKLHELPTSSTVDSLKKKLLQDNKIDKVEVFSKTYSKIYKVLQLLRGVALFFTCIVFIISILLVLKQLRIWIYEHEERIKIMALFGAPFLIKSAPLYKMAIIDSILAALFANLLFIFCSNSQILQSFLSEIDIIFPAFVITVDGLILFATSFIFAIILTTYTVIKAHNNEAN